MNSSIETGRAVTTEGASMASDVLADLDFETGVWLWVGLIAGRSHIGAEMRGRGYRRVRGLFLPVGTRLVCQQPLVFEVPPARHRFAKGWGWVGGMGYAEQRDDPFMTSGPFDDKRPIRVDSGDTLRLTDVWFEP